MYAKHFGLSQEPFSIAPDPRYLFMSERHREALAHLLYGLRGGGGFVLLTGEIGAGKTTVCRCFLEQIPAECTVAYIFNPKLSVVELLQTICEEFHVEAAPKDATVKDYVDRINAFLLHSHGQGRNNVLIIDEAQNLSADVLEQLRLLTNLETNERKLLQIVLIGQPELRDMLARPELEQLAQRVIARFHLEALSLAETAQYIQHRLGVAGFSGAMPFAAKACQHIHKLTRGVPRRINLLCDRALLGAYSQGHSWVNGATIKRAAAEVFDLRPQIDKRVGLLGAAALLAAGAIAATMLMGQGKPTAVPDVAVPRPAASAPVLASSAILATQTASQAWQTLASIWKLQQPGAEPCRQLQAPYRCFQSEAGLSLLRALDRPALLQWRDANGNAQFATLVGLDANDALLRTATGQQRISLLSLGQQWQGDFTVLWRAPEDESPPALTAQFARLFGTAPDEKTSLQNSVAAFQRAQGLKADGRVGPITLMQLNRALGVDEPRLNHVLHP